MIHECGKMLDRTGRFHAQLRPPTLATIHCLYIFVTSVVAKFSWIPPGLIASQKKVKYCNIKFNLHCCCV